MLSESEEGAEKKTVPFFFCYSQHKKTRFTEILDLWIQLPKENVGFLKIAHRNFS